MTEEFCGFKVGDEVMATLEASGILQERLDLEAVGTVRAIYEDIGYVSVQWPAHMMYEGHTTSLMVPSEIIKAGGPW